MADQVRLGLIGAGRIAQVHIKAYEAVPDARWVAVADVVQANREHVAAQLHATPYEDYRELLARDDVDAVLICTPNSLHAEMALAAAKAGKHIFCQKPIALTLSDADAMIEATRQAGVVFQIGLMLRFTPPMAQIKQMIDEGVLGDLITVRGVAFGWEPNDEWFYIPSKGGGVILDTLIHFADLFQWFAGRATRVYAEGGPFVLEGAKKHNSPDNAELLFRFQSGAMGSIYGTWTGGHGDFEIEVYGSRGAVTVTFLDKQAYTLFLKGQTQTQSFSYPAGWNFPDTLHVWGYGSEARHFVDTILGRARPMATGEDGRAALQLVLAAHESAMTGKLIRLDP